MVAGPRRQHDLGLGRGDPSISPAPAGGGHAPRGSIPAHHLHQRPLHCTELNHNIDHNTAHTAYTCHHLHVSPSARVTICTCPHQQCSLGCLTSAARGLAPPCQGGSGLRAEIEKLSAGRGVAVTVAVTGPQPPRDTISCRCPSSAAPLSAPRPPQPAAASFSKSNFPRWPVRSLVAGGWWLQQSDGEMEVSSSVELCTVYPVPCTLPLSRQ